MHGSVRALGSDVLTAQYSKPQLYSESGTAIFRRQDVTPHTSAGPESAIGSLETCRNSQSVIKEVAALASGQDHGPISRDSNLLNRHRPSMFGISDHMCHHAMGSSAADTASGLSQHEHSSDAQCLGYVQLSCSGGT